MAKHIYYAKAKDGRLTFDNVELSHRFRDMLSRNDGRRIRIELEETTRTLAQNSYYWLYLSVISAETGDDAEALHEHFKRRFCPRKTVRFHGKDYTLAKSTTSLAKWEFTEYLDRICTESGVPLPDPHVAGYITNY